MGLKVEEGVAAGRAAVGLAELTLFGEGEGEWSRAKRPARRWRGVR